MKQFVTIFSVAALHILSSCNSTDATLKYHLLSFDTSRIRIFSWDTTHMMEFPKNSDPLPLNQNDLHSVDSILIREVDSYNVTRGIPILESFTNSGYKASDRADFIIDLKKYSRQYFPYKDVNGQRVIFLYCFRNSYPAWKQEAYRNGKNGAGTTYFSTRINLTERISDGIFTGGYL